MEPYGRCRTPPLSSTDSPAAGARPSSVAGADIVCRPGGRQCLNAPAPPPPNRPSTEPVVATCGAWPVRLRVLQDEQAIPHPRPILRPNLLVAQLDHGPPLVWPASTSAAHQSKGSILNR